MFYIFQKLQLLFRHVWEETYLRIDVGQKYVPKEIEFLRQSLIF